MRLKTLAQLGIASVGLAAVSLGIGYGTAHAQQYGAQQGNRSYAAPPMAMGGAGMGNSAVVQDENFLYIVRGSEVYKLNKGDLQTIGSVQLPTPTYRPNAGMQRVPENVPPGNSINNGGSGL